jgi:hypothetical protein
MNKPKLICPKCGMDDINIRYVHPPHLCETEIHTCEDCEYWYNADATEHGTYGDTLPLDSYSRRVMGLFGDLREAMTQSNPGLQCGCEDAPCCGCK